MDHKIFVEQLKNPATFNLSSESKIKMLQTHISFVVLTNSFAYKIKKPVDFGFLDFSTLEKRKYFCHEELRLNSRLCSELYEDVIKFTEKPDGNHLEINGDGPVVDYAVKMKLFPQENIMTNLLQKQKITTDNIDELVDELVEFYKKSPANEEIASFGSIDAVKQNIDENFDQTKDKIDVTISKDDFTRIKKANELFFKEKKDLLKHRKKNGFIKSCHGDLHSGNIVLFNDSLCVFDCIEFNKRFRYIDVASDIGFLAMDLDIQNHPYLSSYFIQQYLKKSNDDTLLDVLNLYKSYRAYVRGKVLGFQLDDPHVDDEKKQMLLDQIKPYFSLSAYYALLMNIHVKQKRPIVFMMSGLTGTGKSTVAGKLAVDYNAKVINTDLVRKKTAGVDKFKRHLDDPNTGLYSPKRVQQTYEKVMEYADGFLKEGKNIVLDATFQKKKHRDMARTLAHKYNAVFLPVYCSCPEHVAKEWLKERLQSESVSDGRWEIYQMQKDSFDMFTDEEKPLMINTAETDYLIRMNLFSSIAKRLKQDLL
ncbi:MAG: AAA family ATPase [Candidatus Thermoplasmatota archaeon]|nr:AAA family ATPase [Candidatus Thermoplasmatota archaeon]